MLDKNSPLDPIVLIKTLDNFLQQKIMIRES